MVNLEGYSVGWEVAWVKGHRVVLSKKELVLLVPSKPIVFTDCWVDSPRVILEGRGGMTRMFGERSPLLLRAVEMIFLARRCVTCKKVLMDKVSD